MKLLQEFKNEYNNITYRLYELDCGIKLIHLENPATVNFDMVITHKAGSSYEDQEKVPHGTAHLLEHMLFKPNSKFKTIEDITKFEEGNKKNAALYTNGGTGRKFLSIECAAHEQATNRIIERINSLVDFPSSIFKKYLLKEKGIVSAERSTKPQLEKFPLIKLLQFIEGETLPEFTYVIIGELNDIKGITLEDLRTYFRNRLVRENTIFAIQSKTKLGKDIVEKLENIGQKYPNTTASPFRQVILSNSLNLGYFYDERATGTTLELIHFNSYEDGIDYQKEAETSILHKLINKLGFDILREKNGLIYDLGTSATSIFSANHIIKSVNFVTENSKIAQMLDSLDKLIYKDLESFIKSEKGTRWLEHILSKYIYPTTVSYNHDLPNDIASTYFEFGELYNYNLFVEEIKRIGKERLLNIIHEFQNIPPHIWVESNLPKKEVEKIVKESSLWKRFK